MEYTMVDGLPILIDFDQSVISREEFFSQKGGSAVERKSSRGISRLLKRIVSPPKKTTRINVANVLRILRMAGGESRVLFVGGGSVGQGMEPFYAAPDMKVVAFDVFVSEHVQFVADAHNMPFPGEQFDCVIVQAVLEHVLNPVKVVSEIYRVLKPTGIVYGETPFLQQVHEGAYDFTRFTESGHRYLFKKFELIQSGVSAGPGTQFLWTLDYFVRSLFRSRRAGKIAKLFFFWIRYLDRFIPERFAIDSASGVFFLGRKKTTFTLTPGDAIKHYMGAQ